MLFFSFASTHIWAIITPRDKLSARKMDGLATTKKAESFVKPQCNKALTTYRCNKIVGTNCCFVTTGLSKTVHFYIQIWLNLEDFLLCRYNRISICKKTALLTRTAESVWRWGPHWCYNNACLCVYTHMREPLLRWVIRRVIQTCIYTCQHEQGGWLDLTHKN